eukprot:GHVP01015767.1.p1 GENE.GHVP01015767.1~~GHVP01015767.1.p1  ORF type:complete len:700 (+),score=88.02 GHVP01015767.1:2257-4356(+)
MAQKPHTEGHYSPLTGYSESRITTAVDSVWRTVAGGSRSATINFTKCKTGLYKVFMELSKVTPSPDDQWYISVFQNFDQDQDGYIAYLSFKEIVKQYHDFHAARNAKKMQKKNSPIKKGKGDPLIKAKGVLTKKEVMFNQTFPNKTTTTLQLPSTRSCNSNATDDSTRRSSNTSGQVQLASHIVVPSHYGSCEVFRDYDFRRTLGKGQFGRVVEVIEKKTGNRKACKTISMIRPDLPQYRDLINQEIELMKSLNHPNILQLYKVYYDGMTIYLIMELCKGKQLFDRIMDWDKKRSFLTEEKVAGWLDQILSATAYCHNHPRKIVHRDIKPENILFLDESQNSILKVVDFGLSSTMDRIRKTQYEVYVEKSGAARVFAKLLPKVGGKSFNSVKKWKMESCGTPHYMAPEMIKGKYDQLCDIFSIGVILFQLLSGTHPFYTPGVDTEETAKQRILREVPNTNSAAWTRVSQEGRELVKWMLEKNPLRRCTAQQARAHSWFKKLKNQAPEMKSQLTSVFQGLQNWQNENRLKQAVLGLLARDLGEGEIHALRIKFMALDKEGNGTISVDDLRASMSAAGYAGDDLEEKLSNIIASFNVDGKNLIGYNEFIAALVARHMALEEEKLREIFDQLDTERKGWITVEDLRTTLKSSERSSLEKNELDTIFASADRHCNGYVDFLDFVDFMKCTGQEQESQGVENVG